MFLMGESINGTRKQVGDAIQVARRRVHQGSRPRAGRGRASVLDVNGGVAGGDEVADLTWLVDIVDERDDTQLMVDSAGPQALDAGGARSSSTRAARCRSSTRSAASSRASTRSCRSSEKYKCRSSASA